MSSQNIVPWKDGFYRTNGMLSIIFIVKGENVRFETVSGKTSDFDTNPKYKGAWKYGDFGEARAEVATVAGKNQYNVHIQVPGLMFDYEGIVSDNGTRVYYWGRSNGVEVFEWESEQSISTYRESGDPADNIPSPHKIQPDNQGKFLFISGAPGLGKSTTAQLLGRNKGYLYS